MSVPSWNSFHVLWRFTFSYPAMNFSFCAVTAVSACFDVSTRHLGTLHCTLFFCSCEFFCTWQIIPSPRQCLKTVTRVTCIRWTLSAVSVQSHTMALPHNDKICFASVPGSGHPIKIPAWSLSYLFDACALLCHTCVSWFKFFCQVLSRASQQLCQRWRVSWADPIVKIRWKSKLQSFSNYHANWKMCARSSARSCRKSRCRLSAKSLRRSALWRPLPSSRPPTNAADDHIRCTVIALSGSVVAELFVLRGQQRLDAIPFGCWCHYWGVGQDSASAFLCMDLKLFWNWLPATIRLQWTFV